MGDKTALRWDCRPRSQGGQDEDAESSNYAIGVVDVTRRRGGQTLRSDSEVKRWRWFIKRRVRSRAGNIYGSICGYR